MSRELPGEQPQAAASTKHRLPFVLSGQQTDIEESRGQGATGWLEQGRGDPSLTGTQHRLGNESSCGAKGEALGCGGVLFHSLLSSIRGSHILDGSAAVSAGQGPLQGAVAKPHVFHHDSA